jgi:hypothetical protein
MAREFSQQMECFAQALALGKKPSEAALIAGYPPGSSFANNARRRANRSDVKARVAELRKPALDKIFCDRAARPRQKRC